jgi:hypothetical protein
MRQKMWKAKPRTTNKKTEQNKKKPTIKGCDKKKYGEQRGSETKNGHAHLEGPNQSWSRTKQK